MAPRVTVITAAFNCSRTLAVALRSVCAQTFESFEYLVIGDGCTDDSEAVVLGCGDPRVRWTNLPVNSGSQAVPNNHGVRQARGEYVAYLGQDDLWWPDHLERLVAHIDATGADLVHAVGAYMGPDGPVRVVSTDDLSNEHAHKSPSMWLHRRTVAASAGPWPDHRGLWRGIDDEYYWRIVRSHYRVSQSPHLTVLKFPAQQFRVYAGQGPVAQQGVYDELMRDPEAFRRAIAAVPPPVVRERHVAWRWMRAVFRWLEGNPEAGRWPFRAIRVARYRRVRRRGRVRAGIPVERVRRTE